MKLSSKKALAVKIQRPTAAASEKAMADRLVERMASGLNAARRSGKFPKVY